MSKIYFLNVNNGDCTWIHHDSGRDTVIDICNGNGRALTLDEANYNRKKYPTNPITFFKTMGMQQIFRFILTHPDMDHMDGIKNLFKQFQPINFWDTGNDKKLDEKTSWNGKYTNDDWVFYQKLHNGKGEDVKCLKLLSAQCGQYYNDGMDNDGIFILSPTQELTQLANSKGEYNLLSYVLLLKEHGRKVIFAGDSGEEAWNRILAKYEEEVSNIDVLIAPHHGRKTGGNDKFLNVLKPKLTLFGNAPSEYLDYNSFNYRNLPHITNNQAGNISLNISSGGIYVYVENKNFVQKVSQRAKFNSEMQGYFYLRL